MAITKNRTKGPASPANLVSTKFISAVDTTKDTAANVIRAAAPKAKTSKAAISAGKANAFDVKTPTDPGNALVGIGFFPPDGSAGCDPTTSVKPNAPDDRLLTSPARDASCGSSVDQILSSRTAAAVANAGMSDAQIVAIETMIASETDNVRRLVTNPPTTNKTTDLANGVGHIKGMITSGKSTLGQVKGLMNNLKCRNGSGVNGGVTPGVKSAVLTNLLSNSMCAHPANLLSSVKELSLAGYATSGTILSSVVDAVKTGNNQDIKTKLLTLANSNGAVTAPNGTDLALTKRLSGSVIDMLKSTTATSTNPILDNDLARSAIGGLDPNWNMDAKGNVNLHTTKNNAYLAGLSKAVLSSGTTAVANIGSTPTAPTGAKLDALHILAANANNKAVTSGAGIPN